MARFAYPSRSGSLRRYGCLLACMAKLLRLGDHGAQNLVGWAPVRAFGGHEPSSRWAPVVFRRSHRLEKLRSYLAKLLGKALDVCM